MTVATGPQSINKLDHRAGKPLGIEPDMCGLTRSLLELIRKEYIDPRDAYEVAMNVDELKMEMKGISSEHPGSMGR